MFKILSAAFHSIPLTQLDKVWCPDCSDCLHLIMSIKSSVTPDGSAEVRMILKLYPIAAVQKAQKWSSHSNYSSHLY